MKKSKKNAFIVLILFYYYYHLYVLIENLFRILVIHKQSIIALVK